MHQARVTHVLDNLDKLGLSQMLINDPLAIFWLTGYFTEPYERFFGLYLSQKSEPIMFCNQLFPDASSFCEKVITFTDTDNPIALVAEACDHTAPLGIDRTLNAGWLLPLMDSGAAQSYRLGSPAVDAARSIKDADECDAMRRASQINDQAMDWLASQLHEGVTEREIAEGLLGEYRRLGADGFSFSPIVSFGANAADPHHEPDDTQLVAGEMALFDVGCKLDAYCSDMTRTFWFAGKEGKEPDELSRRVYETVRAANEAAERIIAPGVTFAEIDHAARSVIEDAGWGPNFTHRLGHQIGLKEHEPGDVSASHNEPVQPGQIFSIEPGIYLEGSIGVRIEDLVIVTDDGCEIINSYPKELTIVR